MASSHSRWQVALARMVLALAFSLGTLGWDCGTAAAQPREELPLEAQKLFTRWQDGSCIGAEEAALRVALLRYRTVLAAAFVQALNAGPPAEELRAARAAAAARYADRSRFSLEGAKISGVSKADLTRFQRTTADDYINDQVQRYATGYRANAVAGLAIVGGAEERALLARIAGNKEDPLAPAATAALRGMPSP